jgi:hypothetical protein
MNRLALATWLLLASATGAQANQVVLSWDFPLAAYPGTRFVLHIVTLQNGRPTQFDRTINPFPAQQCPDAPSQMPVPLPLQRPSAGVSPAIGAGVNLSSVFTTDFDGRPRPSAGPWTIGAYEASVGPRTPWTTLCGSVCLDPGDSTLSLSATQNTTRSGESNLLDVDLSSTTPCQGTAVIAAPPAPPPQQSRPVASVIAGAAEIAGTTALQGSQSTSTPSLPGMVNLQCVQWKITGPCFCTPTTPCVSVEYWEPGWLVETVKKPGTTAIPLIGDALQAAFNALGVPPLGGGGAGNASGSGHTNLQYNEAHVFTFPQLLGGPCTGCGATPPSSALHYASETDPLWRTAVAIPSPLDLLRVLGVWGRLYPRGGKAIHSSEPVGSGIAAARAMDIAFNPIGEPPNNEARVVLQPTGATSSCCQLASPRQTPCFPVGTPPLLWESGTVSPNGTYIWIFWRKRTCCVNPAQSTCGITLPGVGGAGMNGCLLPSLSAP